MDTALGPLDDRIAYAGSMADVDAALRRNAVSRRALLRGGLVSAVAAGSTGLWTQPARAAGVPVVGGHLAYGDDPRSQVIVSFSTPAAVRGAAVEYGPTTAYGARVPARSLGLAGTQSVYHHVPLTGLRPGTTYHYRVVHSGGRSGDLTFRTAPATRQAFSFTAFGDQGVNAGARANVATIARLRPAFHIHVGDLCYNAGTGTGPDSANQVSQANWDPWLAQNAPVATRVPWMPTIGNHEMEAGYGPQGYGSFHTRFWLPRGGPARHVYAFRYAGVGVVSLDANDASTEITANRDWLGGRQEAWLSSTLERLRREVDFIAVGFHHCAYCTNAVHASDGGVRERWGALFDRHGVDLVINGHNHQYERTHPLRGGAVTRTVAGGGRVRPATDGTTYITAGGGGQAAYPATLFPSSYVTEEGGARVPETAPWSAYRYLDTSLLHAVYAPAAGAAPATLRLRGLDATGRLLDEVTLER